MTIHKEYLFKLPNAPNASIAITLGDFSEGSERARFAESNGALEYA